MIPPSLPPNHISLSLSPLSSVKIAAAMPRRRSVVPGPIGALTCHEPHRAKCLYYQTCRLRYFYALFIAEVGAAFFKSAPSRGSKMSKLLTSALFMFSKIKKARAINGLTKKRAPKKSTFFLAEAHFFLA